MKTSKTPAQMTGLDQDEIKFESNAWKQVLAVLRDENVNLKNRLAELLKKSNDRNLLEKAEDFHNCFIWEDERITFLRNEIRELDAMLSNDLSEDRIDTGDVMNKVAVMRIRINDAEKHFDKLKQDFYNSFLKIAG